jgi:RES domain-containing protein
LIVHRLAKAAFTQLDGEGARLFGGRWNSPGRPAVYAAASPSLAVLEVLVHLDVPAELMPDDYRLLGIEIPDDAPAERLEDTPIDAAARLAAGDRFLADGSALVLLVPSVIVPQERNAIINVRHPAMSRIRLIADEPFRFDPKLLGPAATSFGV